MKNRSSSDKSGRIGSFAGALATCALIVISGVFFFKSGEVRISYHQSRWNEYVPDIEKIIRNSDRNSDRAGFGGRVELSHIYGGIASHHIPTALPRLVEFYSRLKSTQSVKNIILIGPDHNDAGRAPVSVSNASFVTGFGELKPIEGLASRLRELNLAEIDEDPFDEEHSIGSQVLIVSQIFPEARVTPIIVRSNASSEQALALGNFLAGWIDERTVIIASVDFSHYLSTDQAMPIDRISGEVARNLDLEALSLMNVDSNMSVTAFMEAMKRKIAYDSAEVEVLNTNDLMENSDNTTGYIFGYWGRK